MCDFENDAQPICSWSHDDDANFKWRRVRGDEVNDANRYVDVRQIFGPDRDHTLGKKIDHFINRKKKNFYLNKSRNSTRTFSIS
jgi:hypothetical protein